MVRTERARAAVFASHFIGAEILRVLLHETQSVEVVFVGTDDPRSSHCNPSNRLWKYGWDEQLRLLVPKLCQRANIRWSAESLSEPRVFSAFEDAKPDFIIAGVFGQRLTTNYLNVVHNIAYNCHLTVPGYSLSFTRGIVPIEKVLRDGLTEIDFTLHRMTRRFDTGEELARSQSHRLDIDSFGQGSSFVDFYRRIAWLPASMVHRELSRIMQFNLSARRLSSALGCDIPNVKFSNSR